ncbi:MAG: hypothetical protein CME68_11570 [Halobacteriovoraceae bacterium]|nr:hypothetical protein [Halobacteriovoraceae bacterium]|tara:strand:- start:293 stop:934 length:642 start_codon:yes stop_codon:yes gene_type:complete
MSLKHLKYCQPEFYKFSEDSLFLANESSKLIKDNFPKNYPIRGLDLCSGCGVVGIETMRQLENVFLFHFLELQGLFQGFFHKNTVFFLNQDERNKVKFYNSDFDSFSSSKLYSNIKYNLIVSNPPYFKKEKNREGADKRRNLCRFFSDSDFTKFLQFIFAFLDKKGIALFLGRDSEIEYDIKTFLEKKSKDFEIIKYKSVGLTSLFMGRFLDK